MWHPGAVVCITLLKWCRRRCSHASLLISWVCLLELRWALVGRRWACNFQRAVAEGWSSPRASVSSVCLHCAAFHLIAEQRGLPDVCWHFLLRPRIPFPSAIVWAPTLALLSGFFTSGHSWPNSAFLQWFSVQQKLCWLCCISRTALSWGRSSPVGVHYMHASIVY